MIINTEEIEQLVKSKSISAYALEKRIGISRMTISKYRNGSANVENMTIENAKKIQKYINQEEKEMKLKWVGRETNGRKVGTIEVEGRFNYNLFNNLYNELIASEILSQVDGDPYELAKLEKNGYTYDELFEEKEWEEIEELIDGLPDLTEEDIYWVIKEENSNAYYQEFYIYINDEEYKVDSFNFEDETVQYDVEDYEVEVADISDID